MYFECFDEKNGEVYLSRVNGIKGIIVLLIGRKYGIKHIPKKDIIFDK